MSARGTLATLFVAAAFALGSLAACAGDEQVLGGGRPTPNNPSTTPTTWTNTTQNNCPRLRPQPGWKCDTFDELGAPIAPQCTYEGGQQICICATGGMWACFRAAPGLLSLDTCADEGTCIEGVGCKTPQHECTCGIDGKLHCVDAAPAP